MYSTEEKDKNKKRFNLSKFSIIGLIVVVVAIISGSINFIFWLNHFSNIVIYSLAFISLVISIASLVFAILGLVGNKYENIGSVALYLSLMGVVISVLPIFVSAFDL